MSIEEFREYCLLRPAVSECYPFDKTTLVFKSGGKIFALTDLNPPFFINLKCIPEKVIELRDSFTAVLPGYHMNSKHWNAIEVDGNISD